MLPVGKLHVFHINLCDLCYISAFRLVQLSVTCFDTEQTECVSGVNESEKCHEVTQEALICPVSTNCLCCNK